jgi:hypothetical protein
LERSSLNEFKIGPTTTGANGKHLNDILYRASELMRGQPVNFDGRVMREETDQQDDQQQSG